MPRQASIRRSRPQSFSSSSSSTNGLGVALWSCIRLPQPAKWTWCVRHHRSLENFSRSKDSRTWSGSPSMCVTAPLSEFCRGDLIFYDPSQIGWSRPLRTVKTAQLAKRRYNCPIRCFRFCFRSLWNLHSHTPQNRGNILLLRQAKPDTRRILLGWFNWQ